MVTIQVAHTADLDAASLRSARGLLYDVFDDMTEPDWTHCLGGMHAVAWLGDTVVGHAALIQRRLLHGGRALRTGYVEGVAVRADCRRQGIGAALMDPLERMIRVAYELGALGATDEAAAFYAARGWRPWQGHAFALTPTGIIATAEEEGAIFVLPTGVAVDLGADIVCDWRDGDVW